MRFIIFIFVFFLSSQLPAAVSVSIDRDPIAIDESFQLIFESDEQTTGQPDFSPLEKNFTIINKSNRNSTQIINGKVSYSQQWVLTALPRSIGQLQIPAIRFGKFTSTVRTINVVNSTSGQTAAYDVFIETSVDNPTPYVQAQVVYTVKLFRSIATSNATLSDPVLGSGQAIIDKLGDDKSYESQRQGKRYVVIERRYVIFPQNSGKITVEPVVFQGQTGSGGFLRFDPFGPAPKTILKRSDPVALDVQPIPASYPGKTWLPASNLSIQEQWSVAPDELQQGQATTRTLTIKAQGLAASHLPAMEHALPDDFKLYPDQPEFEETNNAKGFVGTRKEKMAVIPAAAGEFTLPAITIYWWNTVKDKLELAELPERTIRVAAAATTNNATTATDVGPPSSIDNRDEAATIESNGALLWQWISAALLVLWVATLFAWRFGRRRAVPVTNAQVETAPLKILKNRVLTHARNNDALATSKALIDWAHAQWPGLRIVNLGQLKHRVDGDMQQELDTLSESLYGKNKRMWQGDGLAQAFQGQRPDNVESGTQATRLEPLYKT